MSKDPHNPPRDGAPDDQPAQVFVDHAVDQVFHHNGGELVEAIVNQFAD